MQLVQGREGTRAWEFGFSALGLSVFFAATIPHSNSDLGCTTTREH